MHNTLPVNGSQGHHADKGCFQNGLSCTSLQVQTSMKWSCACNTILQKAQRNTIERRCNGLEGAVIEMQKGHWGESKGLVAYVIEVIMAINKALSMTFTRVVRVKKGAIKKGWAVSVKRGQMMDHVLVLCSVALNRLWANQRDSIPMWPSQVVGVRRSGN